MVRVVEESECKRCGVTWIARVPKPVQCPRCKSLGWEKTKLPKKGAK